MGGGIKSDGEGMAGIIMGGDQILDGDELSIVF